MRLFFGIEIVAPWPEELPNLGFGFIGQEIQDSSEQISSFGAEGKGGPPLLPRRKRRNLPEELEYPTDKPKAQVPKGRLLLEPDRHLTLAFLGETTMPDLSSFPKPSFSIGPAGIFDEPIFFSHAAAWHIRWLEEGVLSLQKNLSDWLGMREGREFISHVTMAREPYRRRDWEEAFQPLPLYAKNIRLYESLGHSRYKVLWEYPLLAPFEELQHTADLAFCVRGDLFFHAQLALAFHFPPLIRYFERREIQNPDEIVTALNAIIAHCDSEIGCPFKAVSFHGTEENRGNEWEMIVDV